jgi:polysaccharide export outer membrane protein
MNTKHSQLNKLAFWTIIILLVPLMGCAGSPQGASLEQTMSQMQAQTKKQGLQEKLMAQTGQATLTKYQDYQVGPEDLLEISFLGQDDLNRELRVNGHGDITVPLVGAVKVGGLSTQKIEEKLVQSFKDGDYIRNPQITVAVKEYRHQRVMVTGAVATPGSYEMIGPRTLLEMLGKAGGLNEKAGDRVHVIRAQNASDLTLNLKKASVESFEPGTETNVIDLNRLLNGGAVELNVPIRNGDVIHVPFASSAYVLGAVNKPGNVAVKENLTVTQAVALAGGLNPMLASDNVSIVRMDENGRRTSIPVSLKQVTNGGDFDPVLKANDIVFVKESGLRRFLFDIKNLFPGSMGVGASALF